MASISPSDFCFTGTIDSLLFLRHQHHFDFTNSFYILQNILKPAFQGGLDFICALCTVIHQDRLLWCTALFGYRKCDHRQKKSQKQDHDPLLFRHSLLQKF